MLVFSNAWPHLPFHWTSQLTFHSCPHSDNSQTWTPMPQVTLEFQIPISTNLLSVFPGSTFQMSQNSAVSSETWSFNFIIFIPKFLCHSVFMPPTPHSWQNTAFFLWHINCLLNSYLLQARNSSRPGLFSLWGSPFPSSSLWSHRFSVLQLQNLYHLTFLHARDQTFCSALLALLSCLLR